MLQTKQRMRYNVKGNGRAQRARGWSSLGANASRRRLWPRNITREQERVYIRASLSSLNRDSQEHTAGSLRAAVCERCRGLRATNARSLARECASVPLERATADVVALQHVWKNRLRWVYLTPERAPLMGARRRREGPDAIRSGATSRLCLVSRLRLSSTECSIESGARVFARTGAT